MQWVPSGHCSPSSYGRRPGGQLRQMLGHPLLGSCVTPGEEPAEPALCACSGVPCAAMLTIGQQCKGAPLALGLSPRGRDSSGCVPRVRCCVQTRPVSAPRCPPDSTPQPLPHVPLVTTSGQAEGATAGDRRLVANPCSACDCLCDLGEATESLCASVSSSIYWSCADSAALR